MKPLSILKYYKFNKKKYIMVLMSVCLSVCLLYVLNLLMDTAYNVQYLTFVEPQKYFMSIRAKGEVLEDGLLRSIRKQDTVEKVIPWVFQYTNINSIIGGSTGTKVLTVRQEDIQLMMQKMGLKLISGRLPDPDRDEIIMHELVARNKKLKIGDKIGNGMDKNEVLPGENTIVGLLGGKSMVSFMPFEMWQKTYNIDDPYRYEIIIIPKKDKMNELSKYLEYLPLQGKELRTFNVVSGQMTRNTGSSTLLVTVISIAIITIVSTNCGFLCYIFFLHRRSEFGILNTIGFTRQSLVTRAFLEILIMNISGFASGFILSLVISCSLKYFILLPMGQPMDVLSINCLLKSACVPLLASLISILPIWRLLNKVDPISIIERVG